MTCIYFVLCSSLLHSGVGSGTIPSVCVASQDFLSVFQFLKNKLVSDASVRPASTKFALSVCLLLYCMCEFVSVSLLRLTMYLYLVFWFGLPGHACGRVLENKKLGGCVPRTVPHGVRVC